MTDLEKLEEYVQKWKNHIQFLKIVKNSNINKETIELWEKKIEFNFKNLIRSSL